MKIYKNKKLHIGLLASASILSTSVPINVLANTNTIEDTNNKVQAESNLDSKLEVNWEDSIGGEKEDRLIDVKPTSDGHLIVAGECALNPSSGFSTGDGLIAKYSFDGKQIWQKDLSGDETDRFYSVEETNDKGFLAVGVSYSTDLGFSNNSREGHAIATKFDKDGNIEWTKGFKNGSNPLIYKNIISLDDGGYLIDCAELKGSVGSGESEYNNLVSRSLVKLDENGDLVSEVKYNISDKPTVITSYKEVEKNKILISGYEKESDSKNNYFVSIVDATNGKPIWIKKGSEAQVSSKINYALAHKGVIYAVGEAVENSNTDAIIYAIDVKSGDIKWNYILKGSKKDSFKTLVVNSKDEVVVIGDTESSDIEGVTLTNKKDVIVAKFTKEGLFTDIESMGAKATGFEVKSAILDKNDKIILIGRVGKEPGGGPCDLVNPCVQFDTMLLSVTEGLSPIPKDDCSLVEMPVITAKDLKIEVGKSIDPLEGVTISGLTTSEIEKKLEITTNMDKDPSGEFVAKKAGEYFIEYTIKDKCGNINKRIKVVAIENTGDSCKVGFKPIIEIKENIVVYSDGKGNLYNKDGKLFKGEDFLKSVEVTGIDTKEASTVKPSTSFDKDTINMTYSINFKSGDSIMVKGAINSKLEKEDKAIFQLTAKNDCGETTKDIPVTVKKATVNEDGTVSTEKPQTGDNLLMYGGLAILSTGGLIAINRKSKNKENNSDCE